MLTSPGALGGLKTETVENPDTGRKVSTEVPVKGDLETVDYLSVSEAGSLLECKPDQWGNDLLRNICGKSRHKQQNEQTTQRRRNSRIQKQSRPVLMDCSTC